MAAAQAATALVFDARPAIAGAAAFEQAAIRVMRANRAVIAAQDLTAAATARLERVQATTARAMERVQQGPQAAAQTAARTTASRLDRNAAQAQQAINEAQRAVNAAAPATTTADDAAAKAAQTYNDDVKRIAATIGKDIGTTLWEQIIGKAKADEVLKRFRELMKNLAVEALNNRLFIPIVAKVVDFVPGLFGIQGADGKTTGGQSAGGGGVPLLGSGRGIGGIDTSWLSGSWLDRQLGGSLKDLNIWLNTPISGWASAPASVTGALGSVPVIPGNVSANAATGIASAGNSNVANTLYGGNPAAGGVTWGNALGAGMYGLNAFMNFRNGNVIGGIGNTAATVMSLIPGLQPFAPIVAIASSLLGGIFGNSKPSNKEGGSTINLATGAETIGGQTGKKFSQENRDAASKLSNAVYDMYGELSDLAGGMKLTKDFFVGVGDRDGIRAQYNGPSNERTFTRDDQGIKDMTAWFAGVFTKELKSGFEEPVQRAIDNIQWDSLDEGLKQLQFAMDFGDTMNSLAGNFSLDNAARKQAKDAVKQTTKAFEELLDTTEQLWPSVQQGGKTITRTTRELTSMPAAEAISQGLLRQVDTYIGEGMNERVWQDLDGNIVNVAADLTGAVSVWKDVTRTVTEGGQMVASAELARAKDAVRARVDLMIAGTPEKTFTAGEAAVAAAKARWDQATIRPLLEMAGYLASEVPAKAADGLRNEMTKLRRANDQGQLGRRLAQGGVDLSTGATTAARYATAVRDVTALYDAGATRTAELAEEQQLLNDTLLAHVGLGRPVSALSVSVADFTAALGLSAAAVGPVTAALDGMQAAASGGTATGQTFTDAVVHLSNLLAAGTIDADQYAASVGRMTSQMKEAVAVNAALRKGRDDVMATIDPAYRTSVGDVMAQFGIGSSVAGVADHLGALRTQAIQGAASVETMGNALTHFGNLLRSGAINVDQYGALVTYINQQYASAVAGQDAIRGGMVGIAAALDPSYRPSADVALSGFHVSPPAIIALRDSLDGLATKAKAGTLASADLYAAEEKVRQQLTAGAITAGQYTQIIGLITRAWQDNGNTAQTAAQAAAQAAAASEQAIHKIRVENTQAQIQTLQTQIQTAEQAESAWKSTADSVRKFRLGLLTNNSLSTLDPAARLAEAMRQYREALAAARTDPQAASDLTGLAQTALEAARDVYASGNGYTAIFAELQSGLEGVETEAQRQARIQTDSLATLRQQLATQQAMLQALQQPSATDLAPVLAGLTTGNLGGVVDWARRQGADTLQAVLSAADARFGIAGNPYRYSATAEDIRRINGRMTDADYLTVGRGIGFTGQLADFNAWVVAHGKQAEYEAAVRQWGAARGYASGGTVPHISGLSSPGTDSVPAWLVPEEGVVTRRGMAVLGPAGLAALNTGRLPINDWPVNSWPANDWLSAANDRWATPANPGAHGDDAGGTGMGAVVLAIDRLAGRVEALRDDLAAHEGGAQRQRSAIATGAEERLDSMTAELRELPRRLAAAGGR